MDNSKAGVQLMVTSMITNRIRRHEVLIPINQNYDKIWERNSQKNNR